MSEGRRSDTDKIVLQRLAIPLHGSAELARERLRAAVAASARIDGPEASTDRRVAGTVTAEEITLSVRDAHISTRRKSWNIEFQGRITETGSGPMLDGAINVPDRALLDRVVWLARVASLVPLVFALTVAIRVGITGSTMGPIAFAVLITGAAVVGSIVMKQSGERAAAEDATALARFLRSALA